MDSLQYSFSHIVCDFSALHPYCVSEVIIAMSDQIKPPSSKITPATQTILTILIAVVIVTIIVILVRQQTTINDPAEVAVIGPTEAWPTPVAALITETPTLTPVPSPLPTSTPTPIPTPTPIIIGSFAELGTLISLKATLQTVVELEKPRPFPLAPERILLAAVGNVEAGIDLTKIQKNNIKIDGTTVHLVLPPAQVTSVELLPDETEIYDTAQGWLLSEYQGLEVEALNTARQQLEQWAVERNNLLTKAEDEAKVQLDSFLKKLGFEEVIITYKRDE